MPSVTSSLALALALLALSLRCRSPDRIITKTRVSLAGINGSFENGVVEDNTIITDTDMVKLGSVIGLAVRQPHCRSHLCRFFRNNAFQVGSTGYFIYAVTFAGHENVNVYGNDASGANFGGDPSAACILVPITNFQDHQLVTVFLSCPHPGAIVGSGTISAGTIIMLSGFGAVNVSVSSISISVSSTISTTTFRWPGYLLLLSQTWTKVTSALVKPERRTISQLITIRYEKPTIIQDGNDDPFVNDRDEAVVGYIKPTPVVTLVNPFELLELHGRLR
ncbi:hypothetical protein JCM21900_001729 [Sporobolomyces salmonicolor]